MYYYSCGIVTATQHLALFSYFLQFDTLYCSDSQDWNLCASANVFEEARTNSRKFWSQPQICYEQSKFTDSEP